MGHLLKPTQIFKSNVKVYPTFSQMQNQPKGVVKLLFNPYDQTKNRNVLSLMDFIISSKNEDISSIEPIHPRRIINSSQSSGCHVSLVNKKSNFRMAIPSSSSTPFQCFYPTSQPFQLPSSRCGCSETEKRDELMGVDIILFDDKRNRGRLNRLTTFHSNLVLHPPLEFLLIMVNLSSSSYDLNQL
ncbi:hypothetical protein YC2023_066891 [Brassica napus]